ncbi:uncharacterized protein LOC143212184 [Lasioglossum baleicum]|uniref:uncharacterized protein LOC143212184 n=1 Tax=Lasioglossum baleicum TaxID=434251 RepID=UPI003FCE5761
MTDDGPVESLLIRCNLRSEVRAKTSMGESRRVGAGRGERRRCFSVRVGETGLSGVAETSLERPEPPRGSCPPTHLRRYFELFLAASDRGTARAGNIKSSRSMENTRGVA